MEDQDVCEICFEEIDKFGPYEDSEGRYVCQKCYTNKEEM